VKYRIKIRHLYWRYFGQPDVPPQDFPVLPSINQYTNKEYYPTFLRYTSNFRMGLTIEEVSDKFNVTRERVRQCLWKAYWRYYAR